MGFVLIFPSREYKNRYKVVIFSGVFLQESWQNGRTLYLVPWFYKAAAHNHFSSPTQPLFFHFFSCQILSNPEKFEKDLSKSPQNHQNFDDFDPIRDLSEPLHETQNHSVLTSFWPLFNTSEKTFQDLTRIWHEKWQESTRRYTPYTPLKPFSKSISKPRFLAANALSLNSFLPLKDVRTALSMMVFETKT